MGCALVDDLGFFGYTLLMGGQLVGCRVGVRACHSCGVPRIARPPPAAGAATAKVCLMRLGAYFRIFFISVACFLRFWAVMAVQGVHKVARRGARVCAQRFAFGAACRSQLVLGSATRVGRVHLAAQGPLLRGGVAFELVGLSIA